MKGRHILYIVYIVLAVIMIESLLAIGTAGLIFAAYIFLIRENKIRIRILIAVTPFILISPTSFYFLFKTNFFYDKILIWKAALLVIKDNIFTGFI
ncbi:MAG: hypothetical protein LBS81_00580 [Endomicrobium sp.]|jgi:hypothetical protein|nr:hypothetical protein [Endomicrobium sp.]